MEDAAKSTKTLADQVLPKQPYYLSLSPTRRYRIHPDEKRLDEQDIRHLQYTTLVGGDADRGILITRAYFAVRDDQLIANKVSTPIPPIDPNKPRKKVSLRDYKNKKVEGESPPKSGDKPNGLPTVREKEENKDPTALSAQDMDGHRDVKRSLTNGKAESAHRRSPSPERRKRPHDVEDSSKPTKRIKTGNATPNGQTSGFPREKSSQKSSRVKSEINEPKSVSVLNGKPTSNNSPHTMSPKPSAPINGQPKITSNGQSTHKRATSSNEAVAHPMPRLLSPLNLSKLMSDERNTGSPKENARPSPKKKPVESGTLKPLPKKPRLEPETTPSTKKRKIPPLLSPTLPAIVMEELARFDKKAGTPLKDTSQKGNQTSDSPDSFKKAGKIPKQDESLHVENKSQKEQYLVTLKYKRRQAKTIERLLNLPPSGGKKKAEPPRKEDRAPRERPGSVEPGTARKRLPAAVDASEGSKRPKTADSLRPSTPPKQSTTMSRIASSSSQAGTPGAANSLTPSAQLTAEKRRPQIEPEKAQKAARLHSRHKIFMELGTKLKHERDGIMKGRVGVKEREHQIAVAAGIQSLLLYMYAVKSQSDAFDLERQPRRTQSWKEVLPLFKVVKIDCKGNHPLQALLCRIEGICVSYMGRSLWFASKDPNTLEQLINVNKAESDIWREADAARRKMGIFDSNSNTSDGGTLGKLVDRLGPWTTPEESVPVALEVLRKVIRLDGSWKPHEELTKIGHTIANGASGQPSLRP
ncbi:hypothetical protein GGR57DRAFT_354500 [Xylariaceae sp. FL1272]|nr:hypothetical protein GGR57DRAFT_354500 [Xylariaceae sp. FL1272]